MASAFIRPRLFLDFTQSVTFPVGYTCNRSYPTGQRHNLYTAHSSPLHHVHAHSHPLVLIHNNLTPCTPTHTNTLHTCMSTHSTPTYQPTPYLTPHGHTNLTHSTPDTPTCALPHPTPCRLWRTLTVSWGQDYFSLLLGPPKSPWMGLLNCKVSYRAFHVSSPSCNVSVLLAVSFHSSLQGAMAPRNSASKNWETPPHSQELTPGVYTDCMSLCSGMYHS